MKTLRMLVAFATVACCVLLLPSQALAYTWQNGSEVWYFFAYENDDGELEAVIEDYWQVDENGVLKELPDNLALTVPDTVPVIWTNEFGRLEKVLDEDGNFVSNKFVTTLGPEVKTLTVKVTEVDAYLNDEPKLVSVTFPASIEYVAGFNDCTNLTTVSVADATDFDGAFRNSPWLKSQGEFVIRNGELVAYQGEATSVTVPDGVEEIGDSAFDATYNSSLTNLTSVTLPESVEEIGDEAFYWCKKLATINIPASVSSIGDKAFASCESLVSVTLPSRLRYLGPYAFRHCGLASVVVPDPVKDLDSGVFYCCTNLTSVTLPASLECIGGGAFYGCTALTRIDLPASLEEIGSSAFSYCWALTSVALPESVKMIGSSAFYWCTNLTSVTGGAGVETLGSQVFNKTALYENVTDGIVQAGTLVVDYKGTLPAALSIPDGVTYIADYAFSCNTDITSLALPASVHTLGDEAFDSCSNLETVTGGEGIQNIVNDSAFYGTKYWKTFWNERGLETVGFEFVRLGGVILGYKGVCPASVVIPDDVTQIFNSLFNYEDYVTPSNITSVTIGSNVKRIGAWAFGELANLATVTGGGSIETIESCAFADCPKLAEASLAGPLIGTDFVFRNDANLTSVTFSLTEPEDEDDEFGLYIGNFDGCDKLANVKVTRAGYELKGWETTTWGSIMGGMDESPVAEEFADELATYRLYYQFWSLYFDDWAFAPAYLSPLWKRTLRMADSDAPFSSDVKSEYIGWLTDASGNLIGTIGVKVSKKGKDGLSKATVAVTLIGQRKTTIKGSFDANGVGQGALAGLVLTANSLSGQIAVNGTIAFVTGARDVNKTKNDPEKGVFAALKDKVWTAVFEPDTDDDNPFANGYVGLSLKMGVNGKVTVKGSLPNGSKINGKAQAILGGDSLCIPVIYAKAKDSFSCLVWLERDGKVIDVDSISEWTTTAEPSFKAKLSLVAFEKLEAIGGQLPFVVSRNELPAALAGVQYGYLPTGNGEPVTLNGNKWTAAKAATIKYKKGVGFDQAAFDKGVAQGKTNLSGLKLTYKPAEGSFKGSFVIYTLVNEKLKKVKANVNGVIVGNFGLGSALIKKVGAMPVEIGTPDLDED